MVKYYLKVKGENYNTASLKAKTDIEEILSKMDYKPLYDNSHKGINLIEGTFKIMCKKEAIILSQYPSYSENQFALLRIIKKIRNIKLISIIHDINSLRDLEDEGEIIKEINFMNSNDCVISHNSKMTKWLKENGVKVPIIDLEIFDYLNNGTSQNTGDFKNVYFAGNLRNNKSEFIYADEMEKLKFKLNLYGPNYEGDLVKSNNIDYKGSFLPEELGKQFGDGFGLIWDGTGINKCDGINGEYLKYNNPHKTSLYLSSGLPVIIWKEAALSNFIEKYKVGFTVNSLSEIENILNNMTIDEYKQLKINVESIKNKLLNGEFTIKAMENAINNIL